MKQENRNVNTTNETYPSSFVSWMSQSIRSDTSEITTRITSFNIYLLSETFVAHIFRNDEPCNGGDHKTFEVMTST